MCAKRSAAIAASMMLTACAGEGLSEPAVAEGPAGAVEAATIIATEQFVLHSEAVGQDYLIQVAGPFAFGPSDPAARFPVVYITDGANTFGPAASSARTLPLEGLAQPAYVVAIGYPTENLLEIGALRQRDLVHAAADPSALTTPLGGRAFEAFLLEELRPLIESRYPVDPDRSVLAGHSLGGLFAATVLRNDPGAFHAYLIGSPWLQFDPTLAGQIAAMADEGGGRRVFLGVGALEGEAVAWTDALESALRTSGSSFEVRRETFDGEAHISSISALIPLGLRHVLPPAAGGAP